MIRRLRDAASVLAANHAVVGHLLAMARRVETRFLGIARRVLTPEGYLRLMYRRGFGEALDLANPAKFSEKIQWLKLYDRNPLIPVCADKLRVRDFVAERIGPQYLVPLLFSGDRPENIPFDRLPENYIIKTSHGSGTNIVVLGDRMILNKQEQVFSRPRIVNQLNKWLKTDFSAIGLEWQYRDIKPMVLIEALLQDESGNTILNDYKVFCFHGAPRYVEVLTDRLTGLKENWYTPDWEPVELLGYVRNPATEVRPENLDELLRIAQALASDFVFVRVDLYSIKGRPYFGELTFHPAGGFERFDPPSFDLQLGNLLSLAPMTANESRTVP